MNAGTSRPGVAPLWSSTALLIRLRMRRLVNSFNAMGTAKKADTKARTGNAGKKSSKVVLYLAFPLMTFMFGSLSFQAVRQLNEALNPPDTLLNSVTFSVALALGVAFLLLLLWVSSVIINVASGELAKPEWDLEWLITLPIRSDTLIWARILERSVVQPSGWLQVGTVCFAVAWISGHRWSALLVAVLVAWPLLLLGAAVRTVLDTGLRLSMSSARLRNLHAVLSVLSIVSMYLAFSMGLPGKAQFMSNIAATMPDWLMHTPVGTAVLALNARDFGGQSGHYALLLAQTGALTWLGVVLLRYQLRHGVISGSARDSGRGEAGVAAPVVNQADTSRARLNAIQRREITLLSRDRNFMVQSLVLPLLIVGGQLLLGNSSVATEMWTNPNVLASVAFGLASYSLSMSAFQTLNTEGHALWLLYTFPRSIDEVLKDKAKLWGVLTLAYPLTLFAIGAFMMPALDWKFLGAMVTALLGIPIYAFIAVALGVFGSNPLEQHQAQKVKPAYLYLYMMLSGLYIYAVVTPNLLQRLIFIMLTVLLAFALWQKARDRLPYLLDPDASPPPRVSLSDGLIAVMVFFVTQAVIGLIVVGKNGRATGTTILVAFVIAGGLTYLLMRWVYARAKTQDVPRIFGAGSLPLLGVAAGLTAGAVAAGYLFTIVTAGWFEDATLKKNVFVHLGWWAIPLAVIAAPIFEEFIFRGLIFGGLRRSFGLWPAALVSAGLFAIVHPAISLVPVFVMGVCAALVYDRTRSLLAPMLTHAVYNACALGAQLWLF